MQRKPKPYKERKPVPPVGGPMRDRRERRQSRQSWREEWEQDNWEELQDAMAESDRIWKELHGE